MREGSIFQGLKHENLLPFIGFDVESSKLQPCLVTMWANKGTVMEYINEFYIKNVEINESLVSVQVLFWSPTTDVILQIPQIAEGLNYLHDAELVHGDLNGVYLLFSTFVIRQFTILRPFRKTSSFTTTLKMARKQPESSSQIRTLRSCGFTSENGGCPV